MDEIRANPAASGTEPVTPLPQPAAAAATPPPDRPASDASVPHTGEAARTFLTALGNDTAALLGRLRNRPRGWKVVGPSMPVRPPPPPQAARRRSAGWRVFTGLVKTFLVIVALGTVLAGGLVAWAVYDVPLDRSAAAVTAPSMVLEASDGQALGRRGPYRVADVALADFPTTMVDAVLSIEDRRFFNHPGVDLFGIARAFNENVAAGHVVEGGSTITQQLVKGMLGDDERTLRRKLREAMVAVALELRLGKGEILHRYLNTIYMGGGAYGVPAAAQLYFGKPVARLTLPEAAMLAGLIQAPSQLNPIANLSASQARAATVIDAMVDNGVITADAAAVAKAQPATLTPEAQQIVDGTWFADWVADQAGRFTGSNGAPLKVRTTLVPPLQKIAEQVVADTLAKSGKAAKAGEAAMVVMRPDGAVLAMVGGRDYHANQFNRAAQAQRQPGSSFKLFVYLAALRAGYGINDTVEDSPITIKDPTSRKTWSPDNYGEQYYGTVTLADAFARSLNTAAVRLAMAAGPDAVVAAARDLGVDAPLAAVPSIALGTNEVTLVDLTGAYASVLRGTMPVQPWGITGVGAAGKDGLMLSAGSPVDKARPLDHRDELMALLQGVVQHGTARAAALPGFAAGKTGTTQDYRDAWFVGFDNALVVGVWVGNDDSSSMERVTGGSLPASIWKAFMTAAAPYEGSIVTPPPAPAPAAGPAVAYFAPNDLGTAPACDIGACSATYQSFRASDCTFQPYFGPRQVCTKGNPTAATALLTPLPPQGGLTQVPALPPAPPALVPGAGPGSAFAALPPPALPPQSAPQPAAVAVTPSGATCDVQACSETFASFRASDCTFQPYGDVPRQVCTRTSGGAAGSFADAAGAQSVPAGVQPVRPAPAPRNATPAQPPPPRGAQPVPQSILDWLRGQPDPGN